MKPKEAADFVGQGLFSYYEKYVKPLEMAYHVRFDKFATPLLTEADFMAAPIVLLMGQYSVGKTTFIRYLLGRDFPGARIGPEPTTDKFCAVMYGHTERQIPGNAAAGTCIVFIGWCTCTACIARISLFFFFFEKNNQVKIINDKDKPFSALQAFGMSFLNRFEVSELDAPLLQQITLIDSPGILSGEKQRLQRGYDFASWSDIGPHVQIACCCYISDELRDAILAIRSNFDKIRCVLNKADQVNQQQLMRIWCHLLAIVGIVCLFACFVWDSSYGALLWSLGKVVQTPEVMRVYISSFWEKEYENKEAEKLFDLEKNDLLADLKSLPREAAIRKVLFSVHLPKNVNEFVKRVRRCKIHALICETLRSKFGFFYK
ncbi:EH-domain containing 4, partial [Reticulomyxa filosa]